MTGEYWMDKLMVSPAQMVKEGRNMKMRVRKFLLNSGREAITLNKQFYQLPSSSDNLIIVHI